MRVHIGRLIHESSLTMADAVFSAQRDMIADLGRTAAQRRVSIVAIKPTTSASSTRLAPLMRELLQ
ncbi:MAG: hypothetical protein CMN59_13050 [Sphingobium sp.]|nr:hypothetical protein [Sphingobium sp.]MBS86292.1 hypothetical protein [Sphingobium sp.]